MNDNTTTTRWGGSPVTPAAPDRVAALVPPDTLTALRRYADTCQTAAPVVAALVAVTLELATALGMTDPEGAALVTDTLTDLGGVAA